jgi:methionyl-tRNA synthetase
VLVSPAMPSVAAEIWRRIGLPGALTDQLFAESSRWGAYPGGLVVEKGEPLFPRIASDE